MPSTRSSPVDRDPCRGRGYGWVEAVGIKNGRIAFAGSAIELETRADPFTFRHELDPDEVAIPGLTDSHLHLADGGIALEQVDLETSGTIDDGLALVPRPTGPARRGVDRGPRLGPGSVGPLADRRRSRARGTRPARGDVGPRSPFALGERSGSRRRRNRPDDRRPGGRIIRRDGDGEPTGVLHEAASRIVKDLVPRRRRNATSA